MELIFGCSMVILGIFGGFILYAKENWQEVKALFITPKN
jgi:hypothetical protein